MSSRSDSDFETLYEDAPCGYVSFLPDGTIVNLNRTLLSWLGHDKSHFASQKKIHDLMPLGERIFLETHLAPLLRTQGFFEEISFHLVTKSNARIPVLATATRALLPDDVTTVYRMSIFKSAERRKFEEELKRERDRAEEATRAKADFLSMLSHEIRTPLTAIIGIANLFETESMSREQADYVDMLQSSADNLMNLLNSILDLSKIDSGVMGLERKEFRVARLADALVRGWQGLAQKKRISVTAEIDPDVPEVLIGDPIKINQILSNLIGNAIKFTHEGSVVLAIKSIPLESDEVLMSFAVRDTGIGIAEANVRRIFDEFRQATNDTAANYGGTGLGLTISQKLALLYGSKIEVESVVGKGSTFCFRLKLKSGRLAANTDDIELIANPSEGLTGMSVLIADDSPDNLVLMEHFFKKWKVKVTTAGDGKTALQKLSNQSFNVILLDVQMPGMSGVEVAKRIRALPDTTKSTVPIIAFSGASHFDGQDLAGLSIFNSVVGKPFKPSDLISKLLLFAPQ